MIQQVLNIMQLSVSAVSSWFAQILDATGAGILYIAMMSVVLSVGVLLTPLLGSFHDSSDLVASGTRKMYSSAQRFTANYKHSTNYLQRNSAGRH